MWFCIKCGLEISKITIFEKHRPSLNSTKLVSVSRRTLFLIYDVAITTLKLRSLQDVARIFVQILVLLEICHTQQYLK